MYILKLMVLCNNFSTFIKTCIKKYHDFQVHFSTLTLSFFITFILNYAIFNLPIISIY